MTWTWMDRNALAGAPAAWMQAVLAVLGACCAAPPALAFAFVVDSDGADPYLGRRLWTPDLIVADPLDPTRQVMALPYAFAPPVGTGMFSLALPGGTVLQAPMQHVPFSDVQRAAIGRAVAEWVGRARDPFSGHPTDNLVGVGGAGIDLQSVAVHELGHVLGLGHPNPLRRRSNANVKNAAGDPDFTLAHAASKANLAFNATAIQEYAGTRPLPPGVRMAEAAMIQGIVEDEVQWSLATDDVQGLSALQAGKDGIAGTADDYRFVLTEVGFAHGKRISFFNVDAAFFDAFLGVESVGVPGPDPVLNPGNHRHAKVILETYFPAGGGGPLPAALSELFFTADPASPGAEIAYANVFLLQDLTVNVPEPQRFVQSGEAIPWPLRMRGRSIGAGWSGAASARPEGQRP